MTQSQSRARTIPSNLKRTVSRCFLLRIAEDPRRSGRKALPLVNVPYSGNMIPASASSRTYHGTPNGLFPACCQLPGFTPSRKISLSISGMTPSLPLLRISRLKKMKEGALQQDISLINIDPRRVGLPGILSDYLGRQGLHVVEPFQTEVRKKLPEGTDSGRCRQRPAGYG